MIHSCAFSGVKVRKLYVGGWVAMQKCVGEDGLVTSFPITMYETTSSTRPHTQAETHILPKDEVLCFHGNRAILLKVEANVFWIRLLSTIWKIFSLWFSLPSCHFVLHSSLKDTFGSPNSVLRLLYNVFWTYIFWKKIK